MLGTGATSVGSGEVGLHLPCPNLKSSNESKTSKEFVKCQYLHLYLEFIRPNCLAPVALRGPWWLTSCILIP